MSFNECLKSNPQDNLSKTYIERCNLLIKEKPTDWDGVWVMKANEKLSLRKRFAKHKLHSEELTKNKIYSKKICFV